LSAAPAVSVCIPTYRGAAHIAETIESALAQTFADFELIVIDDDSPDETGQLVARYRDPRLRYLRERNAGVKKTGTAACGSRAGAISSSCRTTT